MMQRNGYALPVRGYALPEASDKNTNSETTNVMHRYFPFAAGNFFLAARTSRSLPVVWHRYNTLPELSSERSIYPLQPLCLGSDCAAKPAQWGWG
jgi:hypothetical protein